ncbi:hypothetical protein [Edaphobacter flagellatus]|uniref:hypothetical protein n=1 Tax=Edaphobacter flagellatus TaxID=1933044 RepID=UPI0021B281B3|nr:hypothetical protein [Edaphobacter flagellatus]
MHLEPRHPEDDNKFNRIRCRHTKPDGARCGSPALRGSNLCHYHSEVRGTPEQIRQRKARHHSFALPSPRSRAGLQDALGTIMHAIAGNEIDLRRAGLLLYALQIANSNLNEHQRTLPRNAPNTALLENGLTADPPSSPDNEPAQPHYGSGPRPQYTSNGEPFSTTQNHSTQPTSLDFTPPPALWRRCSPATGRMLLETLGRHHGTEPLPGSPQDRFEDRSQDRSDSHLQDAQTEIIPSLEAASLAPARCHSERKPRVAVEKRGPRRACSLRQEEHPYLRRISAKPPHTRSKSALLREAVQPCSR